MITEYALEGARTYELNILTDERGFFSELLRQDWGNFVEEWITQVNLTYSYPNIVRAWHRHNRGQVDYFLVLNGAMKICAYEEETQRLAEVIASAEIIYMSIFVLGELYAGFSGGSKEKENRGILNRFLLKPTVKILNATAETADVFGMIKKQLKTAGTPLPINDVWIGAHAIETGSVVVTYDKHFKKITGLRLWSRDW